MDPYASNRHVILDKDLEQITKKFPDFLQRTEESILCVKECLQELKEHVCKNPFASPAEEIYFFKEIKPTIYGKLIFFVEIFKIESKRPVGNICDQKKYLLREQKKLRLFFDDNVEFYTYYRNKSTHLDEKYFLRNEMDIHLCLNDYVFDTDPCFSTSHDHNVAKIQANDMLNFYLNEQLNLLEQSKDPSQPGSDKCKFVWTESKVALVELIYGLHATGCINNGSTDIKEIARYFETIFNIELGDFYHAFTEIKTRQTPAKFIKTIQGALEKKIDDI